MEFRTPTVSPLRQRTLDDMRMCKRKPPTQAGYIRAVRRLATFLERTPALQPLRICAAFSCTWSTRAPRRSRSAPRSPP